MCLNPKWIYKKGHYKRDNYRGQEGEFYELGTYSKCGCCEECINEKCNNWVVRNFYESKAHQEKSFITLTYKENSYILIKKDLQDFKKRLRRKLDYKHKKKIRFFDAGEYGTVNGRPHFHLIIYGWTDKNKKYIGINKKGSIIYKSDIIEKTWGLGITSYQEFDEHEIPYITLYETPQETFKKAYKLNLEKCKQLRKLFMNNKSMQESQRKNALKELREHEKELKKTKEKYLAIKEFNTWSKSLGWEEFEKQYIESEDYAFKEYIEDKEFSTPSPWVKKLANMGDIKAKEEMLKREKLMEQASNEQAEKNKNEQKFIKRRKKEIKDWIDKKDKISEL